MDGMTPAHAKAARRDHTWVLAVIAACCLIKVWPSWVGIGAEAGFPKLGRIATDWTLAVVIEAYWAYAVYAWLAAEGWRSRRFAFWSAAVVFALSVVGQSAAPVMAASAVKVFANALPVIVLALVAILIHLRRLDREESADADERTAVQAETDALRAQLAAAQTSLETAQSDRAAAQDQAAQTTAKCEVMARKLAARSARSKSTEKRATPPRSDRAEAAATEVPDDVDARAEALSILAAEPDISGAQLGLRVNMSKRWGQTFKNELAAAAPKGQDPQE
jgi:hypothetical protein